MAERERSKDRPKAPYSPGLFMGLFGGGSRRGTSSPSSTRARATIGSTTANPSAELVSPRSQPVALPPTAAGDENPLSPTAGFDLHTAIELMQGEKEKSSHVADVVDQTATYLASLLTTSGAEFGQGAPPDPSRTVKPEDIRTLYARAIAFADTKTDSPLRTSAIRLLAALIATYPPTDYAPSPDASDIALPENVNARYLYHIIVSPTTPTTPAAHVDALFVQVGAIKALTKSGKDVASMDGLVGWLVRNLTDLAGEFALWCARKEEDLKVSRGRCCFETALMISQVLVTLPSPSSNCFIVSSSTMSHCSQKVTSTGWSNLSLISSYVASPLPHLLLPATRQSLSPSVEPLNHTITILPPACLRAC